MDYSLLEKLKDWNIDIHTLTTDQHLQIRCFPEICHQFDVWHKSKGIKKKLFKAAKKKANSDLIPWICSIVNHFWWCCATCEEDHMLLWEKWVRILYHVCDVHEWEGGEISKKFPHNTLPLVERVSKNWLQVDSAPYLVLKQIVLYEKMINELVYFVKFKQWRLGMLP